MLPGEANSLPGVSSSLTVLVKVKKGRWSCLSESRIKTWGLQSDFFSFGDFCQSGGWASYSINQQGERERERAGTDPGDF